MWVCKNCKAENSNNDFKCRRCQLPRNDKKPRPIPLAPIITSCVLVILILAFWIVRLLSDRAEYNAVISCQTAVTPVLTPMATLIPAPTQRPLSTPAPTSTPVPSPAPTTIYGKKIDDYHHNGVEISFPEKIDCITQTYQSRIDVNGIERNGPTSRGYSSVGYDDNKYGFYYADGQVYFIEGRSDGVTNLGLYYWDGKLIAVHDITGAGEMFVEGDYVFERVRDDYQKLYDIAMGLERVE